MEFEFDFNVSAWIRGLKIEAKSSEEAKEILGRMTLAELAEEGIVKEMDITDLDYKETSATYEVEVKNVHLDPAFFEYETEEERREIINRKFSDFKFNITLHDTEDLDEQIELALEDATELSGTWTYTKEIIEKY